MSINQEEEILYNVVINSEEQYSIWPTFKTIPSGWFGVGVSGTKDICLAHIKEVWKDMRPLSLRKKIDEDLANRKNYQAEMKMENSIRDFPLSSTVSFLIDGMHSVTTMPTNKNCHELKASLDRGYIHLTFTETQGQTTVGMQVIPDKTVLHAADFELESGIIHIEGSFILDYVRMICMADIDLSDMKGVCRLEMVERLKPFQALSNSTQS